MFVSGSNAAPPQFASPLNPGLCTTPSFVAGLYIGTNRIPRRSRIWIASRCSSGVKSITSFAQSPCKSKAAGFVGKGCVGEAASPGVTERNRAKLRQVLAGQDRLMTLIKKYGIKTGFGTDFVFGSYVRLNEEFTARADYFTPAEILRQATSESAEVIRLCGKLNRYGNFGEIREGWLADLLLIEGDPFSNISILEHPDKSLAVIMKDGQIVQDNRR